MPDATLQNSLAPLLESLDIAALMEKREDQWFDRKSVRITPRHLADALIGFANADGGRIVIGIHNKEVEGINASVEVVNDLLQAAQDYTAPPVRHRPSYIDCINAKGEPDRLLII